MDVSDLFNVRIIESRRKIDLRRESRTDCFLRVCANPYSVNKVIINSKRIVILNTLFIL